MPDESGNYTNLERERVLWETIRRTVDGIRVRQFRACASRCAVIHDGGNAGEPCEYLWVSITIDYYGGWAASASSMAWM